MSFSYEDSTHIQSPPSSPGEQSSLNSNDPLYDPLEESQDGCFCRNCVLHRKDWMELPDLRQWASRINNDEETSSPPFRSQQRRQMVDQIAENNAKMEQLEKQIHELRIANSKIQTLLSPIRQLPPEILGRIFYEISQASHQYFTFKMYHNYSHPILLVCRSWREIALSTPNLWSKIELAGILNGPLTSTDVLTKLREWLARSKGVPLSITSRVDTNKSRQLLDALYESVDRWRSFRLLDVGVSQVAKFFNRPQTLPLLVELVIQLTRTTLHDISEFTCADPLILPNLQVLWLHGAMLKEFMRITAPNLKALTLVSCILTYSQVTHIGSSFPRLSKINLQDVMILSNENATPPSFPNLRKCRWQLMNEAVLDLLLFQDVPKLKYLTIDVRQQFFTLHKCRIPSLAQLELFLERTLHTDDPTWFLEYFPNISKLSISFSNALRRPRTPVSAANWLDALKMDRRKDPNSLPLLPNLASLSLTRSLFDVEVLAVLSRDRCDESHLDPEDLEERQSNPIYKEWHPKLLISATDCAHMLNVSRVGHRELRDYMKEFNRRDRQRRDRRAEWHWGLHVPHAPEIPAIFEPIDLFDEF